MSVARSVGGHRTEDAPLLPLLIWRSDNEICGYQADLPSTSFPADLNVVPSAREGLTGVNSHLKFKLEWERSVLLYRRHITADSDVDAADMLSPKRNQRRMY